MKTPRALHAKPTQSAVLSPVFGILLAVLFFGGRPVQADNILANPGFESSPVLTGWSAHTTESWSIDGANTQGKLYRSGNNGLWMQGLYGNGGASPYYNMYVYQKIAAAPGASFAAEAWFSEYSSYYQHQGGDNGAGSGLLTSDAAGVEDCWVEVQFLDSANNILADYKSAIISPLSVTLPGSAGVSTINVYNWPRATSIIPGIATNIYLQWIHCPVTNQFDISTIGPNVDPATESVTNTLSDGIMVAPPGTAYVQYMLCLAQAQYESGANYWDDCTLNQVGGPSPSVIAGLTPDGSKFFNTNTCLTFNVVSASTGGAPLPTNPMQGIKVVMNGVDQSANLQFSGSPTALSVLLPGLTSNAFYNVSISISNSAGLLTTANPVFDTLAPVFIVPAETFDFNGGQFIQNPIPTSTNYVGSYFGRFGSFGIDMWTYNGTGVLPGGASTLAPSYPNRADLKEAFEVAPDTQLPLYAAARATDLGVYNVSLSYNNPGNWFNYTRNPWPSGYYQVLARISGGQGAGAEYLNLVTSGYGTATQTTNNLGQFYLANGTDWTKYRWIPLTDSDGNLVPVTLPGGRQTLQLCSSRIAGENVISFIFVSFPATGVPPSISHISPADGAVFAPASAGISFTTYAGLGSALLNASGINLTLNGVDVTSDLHISGPGPFNISYSNLFPNNFYTAVIAVTNTAGAGTVRTVSFDTMSTNNFYVKLEDFDYSGGQWDTLDNGIGGPLAYFQNSSAIANVDYFHTSGGIYPFRSPGLATEITADVPLPAYFVGGDYDVGNFNPGDWGNYTRNYPPGDYLVYGRFAGYNPVAYLDKVTGGVGTLNQTTQRLGTWRANSVGWQNWVWTPLMDGGGTVPAVVTLGGTNTLRVISGGNVNANYFMLVTHASCPAVIDRPPATQTAELGATVGFLARAHGLPPLRYEWLLNQTNLICVSTNPSLPLVDVQIDQVGMYQLVVTNGCGAVTSAPAILNVIAPVERRMVPALNLTGQPGSSVNLEFSAAVGPAAQWTTLDSVLLSQSSQQYFDVSAPAPPQRFYRVSQTLPSGITPALSCQFVPALTLSGNIGDSVRIDYINAIGPTDAWVTLNMVTLTNTSQLYFDTSSLGQPRRLYRLVPVP